MSFDLLQVFHVELWGLHRTLNWSLYLINGVDFSNSVNPDRVQVLSYSKYSCYLPVIFAQSAGAVEYTDCFSAEG